MGRVSASTLATACAIVSLAAGACGDGERSDPRAGDFTSAGSGGSTLGGEGGGQLGGSAGAAGAGEPGGDGSGALGGTSDGSGGSSRGGSGGSRPRGGGGNGNSPSAGGGDTGGHAGGGTAGDGTNGGSGAEAGEVGIAGDGPGGTPVVEQLDVCIRQTSSPSVLGWDVSHDFESAVNLDCRISWVRLLYLDPANGLDERVDFLNQVIHLGLDTWGCVGASPPQRFDLIWVPTALSAADIGVLIDHYVEAATGPLTLSAGEIADMRAILGRLAEPLAIQPDPGDFSNPRCDDGGGGGGAGAGGQAGSG